MNTIRRLEGSDSSMDDCNIYRLVLCMTKFIRSDSSMDDCNPA